MAEIYALRDAMTPEQRENPVWDAENNMSWSVFEQISPKFRLNSSIFYFLQLFFHSA